MAKPVENRQQFAKRLWDAANAAYGSGLWLAADAVDLVRIYEAVKATAEGSSKAHSIRRMKLLLDGLDKLSGDAVLKRDLRAIEYSGGSLPPDFHEYSRAWRGLVQDFVDADGESDNADHLGPIVPVMEWIDDEKVGLSRLGVTASGVVLHARYAPYDYPREAEAQSVEPPGKKLEKFCLVDLAPQNVRDAREGATLTVAPIGYETIFRCDPYFHAENKKALLHPELPETIKNLTGKQRFAHRLKYGSLQPSKNQIPYALTLFYTIVLKDEHILLMRRSSSEVGYYPSTIEPSGGEQLDRSDFRTVMTGASTFERWARRGVLEEYLPTEGLSRGRDFDTPGTHVFGKDSSIHLQAVGFNVLDGSFPIFALVRSPLCIGDYLALCQDLKTQHHLKPRWENEGRRGWVDRQSLVDGLSGGVVSFKKLAADGSTHVDDTFSLSSEDLHPMTMMRFYLLWRSFPNWWKIAG